MVVIRYCRPAKWILPGGIGFVHGNDDVLSNAAYSRFYEWKVAERAKD